MGVFGCILLPRKKYPAVIEKDLISFMKDASECTCRNINDTKNLIFICEWVAKKTRNLLILFLVCDVHADR